MSMSIAISDNLRDCIEKTPSTKKSHGEPTREAPPPCLPHLRLWAASSGGCGIPRLLHPDPATEVRDLPESSSAAGSGTDRRSPAAAISPEVWRGFSPKFPGSLAIGTA